MLWETVRKVYDSARCGRNCQSYSSTKRVSVRIDAFDGSEINLCCWSTLIGWDRRKGSEVDDDVAIYP